MGFQLQYPQDWSLGKSYGGSSDIFKDNKYYVGIEHSFLNYDNTTPDEKINLINSQDNIIKKLSNVPGVIIEEKIKDGSLIPVAIVSTGNYIVIFDYRIMNLNYLDEYHKDEIIFYEIIDSIQIIK